MSGPLEYLRIQEKLEARLKKVMSDIAWEEGIDITHNCQVYASKRGLNLQIQIQVRPKEGT